MRTVNVNKSFFARAAIVLASDNRTLLMISLLVDPGPPTGFFPERRHSRVAKLTRVDRYL